MSLAAATPVAFVSVNDRDRALAFYRDTLGLSLKSSDDFGDMYHSGAGLLRLTPMPDHRPHPHPVVGWDVSDIAATARALSEKGVEFSIYEGMGQDELGIWSAPDGGTKLAWFADPFGNVLSLSQNA